MTNNISECLNSVIKRFADWPGISMDAIVTSLFFLQRYKYNEIIRGRLLCGDMKLKENYMDFVLDPATVEMPRSVCLPDQIVDMIQGGKLELPQQEDVVPDDATRIDDATDGIRTDGMLQSQRGMARAVILEKRIINVPEAGAWVVTGSKNDKYAVSLFPEEKCNCAPSEDVTILLPRECVLALITKLHPVPTI